MVMMIMIIMIIVILMVIAMMIQASYDGDDDQDVIDGYIPMWS